MYVRFCIDAFLKELRVHDVGVGPGQDAGLRHAVPTESCVSVL